MPSNHLILCCPLLLLPSVFPNFRVFSNELALRIRWPKCWSFSFSISPSNECSGLLSFRIDWFDLCNPRVSQESFPAPLLKSINPPVFSLLYGPALTSMHSCNSYPYCSIEPFRLSESVPVCFVSCHLLSQRQLLC